MHIPANFDVEDDEHVGTRYAEEVDEFCAAMKNKLMRRAHKGDFMLESLFDLAEGLCAEVDELQTELDFGTPERAMDESIDVANYALFIYHKSMQNL